MNITKQQIEEGRKSYEEFHKGMSGGFTTYLFEAIAKAKGENIYKMALGYPGEVYAYREYIGALDPYHWDIEGETAAEKFNRLTAKPEQLDFHYNGVPLSDEDLQVFNGILEAIVKDAKGMN